MTCRDDIIERVEELLDNGELSRKDFYVIGLMHRELPKSQRSWEWLSKLTGWRGTAESYRCFVKDQFKKPTVVVRDEEVSKVTSVSRVEEEKHELFMERQKLRDERTSLNALLRDASRVDRFKEELMSVAKNLNSLPAIKCVNKVGKSEVEAVALLSDLHLGMQIDEYCNTYNVEIATKRLDKWTDDVIKYCTANKVKRLNVVNLGDLIAGEIHPSIRVMQEIDVAEQVMKAGELLARALNKLQMAAPFVVYRSVSDNHARFTPDLHQSIERENFFRLIDWWLEARLSGTNIKMPKDNVSFMTGQFRLMNGKLCMFEHGHKLKPNNAFQDLIGLVEEYVHYVFIAHYHSEKMKTFQNMRVFVNGSICGTDPYADSIHKYSKPKQSLLIFDDDNLINISIDLDIRE